MKFMKLASDHLINFYMKRLLIYEPLCQGSGRQLLHLIPELDEMIGQGWSHENPVNSHYGSLNILEEFKMYV